MFCVSTCLQSLHGTAGNERCAARKSPFGRNSTEGRIAANAVRRISPGTDHMAQQPDNVTAKDSGGNFTPHPEGQHAVLCVDVVDLGISVEQFPGQPEPKEIPKIALVFASGIRQKDDQGNEDGLIFVTAEMTNSANEKANLRKFLEDWRGKSYDAEQIKAGLPLNKLHGKFGLASIEHKLTRKNRTFAQIKGIVPLPVQIPAPDAKAILGEYKRPQFLIDRKARYAETLKKHRGDEIPEPQYPGDDDDPESVPF